MDASRSGEEKTVTIRAVDSTTGQAILPDQTMELTVNAALSEVANELDVGYYSYDYTGQSVDAVSTACDTYTLAFTPMTDSEIQEAQFWEQVEQGTRHLGRLLSPGLLAHIPGENPRKCLLLFGDQNKRRFANEAEAQAAMTTVIIPVEAGERPEGGSTMSLSVHSAIAQDVVEIFTEIYNDPEQFPIHDVGGYSWRGDTATGRAQLRHRHRHQRQRELPNPRRPD